MMLMDLPGMTFANFLTERLDFFVEKMQVRSIGVITHRDQPTVFSVPEAIGHIHGLMREHDLILPLSREIF